MTTTATPTKPARGALTPVAAIGKIGKILEQLASPLDRKRVIAFVAEGMRSEDAAE